MSEATSTSIVIDNFLDYLVTLAWCKQGEETLVAVHKCTPEIIVTFTDREARVHPGNMVVKINKSWLSFLQEKNSEGTPVPVLIVWKAEALELWYRRNKSFEFPYDAWQDPAAAAYEREVVRIPAAAGGEKFARLHGELLSKANACPAAIPLL